MSQEGIADERRNYLFILLKGASFWSVQECLRCLRGFDNDALLFLVYVLRDE